MRTLLATWLLLLLFQAVPATATTTIPAFAGDEAQAFDRQVLVLLHAPAGHARPGAGYGAPRASPGRQSSSRIADALAREHGLTLLADWPIPSLSVDCYVMQIAPGASRDDALQALASDKRVDWAQPMHVFDTLGAGDPLYPVQPAAVRWHLRRLHDVATGKGVVIAQIDSGVELDHPDLRGQVLEARNVVPGQSFVAEQHGTAVAGILVARADNGIGIAGIAPQARLLALRACWQTAGGSAQCNSFTLALALEFALQSNAKVLNLSLGGPDDRLLGSLLDVALKQGITVVAAVDAQAADGGFPAAHPGVLAVASENSAASIPGALLAPGLEIPTTTSNDGWGMVSGSSYAAAQVSGLVALLEQLAPSLRPAQLRDLLAPQTGLAAHSKVVDACAAIGRTARRCACDCGAELRAAAITGH